jgi:Domain of unknown function (DUF4390)
MSWPRSPKDCAKLSRRVDHLAYPPSCVEPCPTGRQDVRARTGRLRVWAATAAALALTFVTVRAEDLRIVPLVRDGQVLVSFQLTEGFTDQVRDAIRSGLRTTFTFNVELRLAVPAWVDRTIATSIVTNSVEYDNLTREARLARIRDGRLERQEATSDDAVIREWMTGFNRMPLFPTTALEPNREYYVRVVATARPTNGVLLWPWGTGTSGQAKFTFIR